MLLIQYKDYYFMTKSYVLYLVNFLLLGKMQVSRLARRVLHFSFFVCLFRYLKCSLNCLTAIHSNEKYLGQVDKTISCLLQSLGKSYIQSMLNMTNCSSGTFLKIREEEFSQPFLQTSFLHLKAI